MKTTLRALILLATALPLFAGTFERFPLPRTVPSPAYDLAIGANAMWMIGGSGLVKTDLDGNFIETTPDIAGVLVTDPSDGSLWWTNWGVLVHVALDGTQTRYALSHNNAPYGMTFGPNDSVWIIGPTWLTRVTRAGVETTVSLSSSGGYGTLLSGPDGNLWAIDYDNGAVAKITTAGEVTKYGVGYSLSHMAFGPNGDLWIVSHSNGALYRMTLDGASFLLSNTAGVDFTRIALGENGAFYLADSIGIIRKYEIGAGFTGTYDVGDTRIFTLRATNDGLWFTDEGKYLGELLYAGTSSSELLLANTPAIRSMTASGDDFWFVAWNVNQVGRMTQAGVVDLFDLPTPYAYPQSIATGADGNVWLTEHDQNKIAMVNVLTEAITEYPTLTADARPGEIVLGSDGKMWFTTEVGKVGRISPAGVVTEFVVPNGFSPTSITLGPDGNIWITANRVYSITPDGVFTDRNIGSIVATSISNGPDSKLYFRSSNNAYRIGVDGSLQNLGVLDIGEHRIVGPDGLLWYAQFSALKRVRADFHVESIPAPAGHSFAEALVNGSDAHVWVAGEDAVYRVTLDAAINAAGTSLCLDEAATVSGVIATFSDPDASRDATYYTARVAWDDSSEIWESATVAQTAPGQFSVSGTHTYPYNAPRTVRVEITALPGPNRIGGMAWTTSSANAAYPIEVNATYSGAAATHSIALSNPGSCSWSASSNRSWITVPANGSGTTLQLTLGANDTGASRSGTVTINGTAITVTQTYEAQTSLYLVTPCRIYDSRNTNTPLAAGAVQEIAASGKCGIPVGTRAIVSNITVVAPASSGWLAAYKAGTVWPGHSTINFRTGKTRANNSLIPLSSGAFNIKSGASVSVHFIVDVTGYFQ